MREIKFRGKRVDNNEWTYGWYYYDILCARHLIREDKSTYAIPEFYDNKVIPETIGEFTGLKDKNGVEIYEGDIVQFEALLIGEEDFKGTVIMQEGCWTIDNGKAAISLWQECSPVEVISNIHNQKGMI